MSLVFLVLSEFERNKNLAENFYDIRSFFDSRKKQGKDLFEIAKQVLDGKKSNS